MNRSEALRALMHCDPVWVWTDPDGTRWLSDRSVITCHRDVVSLAGDTAAGACRLYAQRRPAPSSLPVRPDAWTLCSAALHAMQARTGWQPVTATAWTSDHAGPDRTARLMRRADGTVALVHETLWQAWRTAGSWEHTGPPTHGGDGLFRITSGRAVTYLTVIGDDQIAYHAGQLTAQMSASADQETS